MLYKISVEPDYLRAELFNRETMEEMREFLRIVASSALKHNRSRVLISVRSSNPIFTVERSGFLQYFKKLVADPSHKIALLGDSEELGISHQYVELIGRQHGAIVQSFRDETAALSWFRP
ncbi:MAG: STAS/SEC14 domain-containing protein [Burkholderiales bacterium]